MFLLFWLTISLVFIIGNKQTRSSMFSVFKVLISVLAINTFIAQVFVIPSGSMLPGLEVGDRIFVSKYAYGYNRSSFPNGNFLSDIFFLDGIFSFWQSKLLYSEPKRGDVIVFKPNGSDMHLIKRLVGLPDDKVQMINQDLHVNGEKLAVFPAGNNLFFERNLDGKEYLIRNISYSKYDNTREFIVPEDHFFFMGDNRDESFDSRAGLGMISSDELVGRAERFFFNTNLNFIKNPIRWVINVSFKKFMGIIN